MSRLDSFIRRVSAQRDCLNHCATLVQPLTGVVFEIGLGNGRTYDHLRSLFPQRAIYAFDRQVAAHRDCIPPASNLFVGELEETFPLALQALGRTVAFAHVDIGSGNESTDQNISAFISTQLQDFLIAGAYVASDQPLCATALFRADLPAGVAAERYFLYTNQ